MNVAALVAAAFVALYAGHMVGDHVVQTDRQARGKGADKGWLGPMVGHLAGYGLAQANAIALLLIVGVPLSLAAAGAGLALSVATHGFIDRRWPVLWLMRHTGSASFAETAEGPYKVDQTLHIAAIFLAALVIGGWSA